MTHPILTEHPRWTEHRRTLDKLDAAQQKWIDRSRVRGEEWEQTKETHRAAVEEAVIRGTEPPPDPEPPPEGPTTAVFLNRRRDLDTAEKRLLGEIAPEIEVAAEARETELEDQARALLDRLRPIAAELSDLGTVLSKVRQQQHVEAGITPASRPRTRTELDVPELAQLIEAGVRPLDPIRGTSQEARVWS